MRAKCKMIDLVDDLVDILNVTEITMDDAGFGIAVADLLKERGIKVNIKKRNRRK